MIRTSVYFFAALTVLAASGAANAAAQFRQTQQITVSYSDLNLSNPAGAEDLLSRLRRASNKVCGGTPDAFALTAARRHYRDCVQEAMNNAVVAVNSPLVAQLYGVPGLYAHNAVNRVADNR